MYFVYIVPLRQI